MSNNVTGSTIVIVGGSTGGASTAAQIRRMDENIRIILIERTQYISTAYCGLAYAAGGIVTSRDELIPLTPEAFSQRFNIDVRLNCSAVAIDRKNHQLQVQDEKFGNRFHLTYTALVLATGASSIIPDICGSDLAGVFSLRNIPDLDNILPWVETRKPKRVVIVGAGFIGLELAESFTHKGCEIHLIEAGSYAMPKMDADLMAPVHDQLRNFGVKLYFNTGVQHLDYKHDQHQVLLSDGQQLTVDMVLLVTGIRPDTRLALDSALTIGSDGGILVDTTMRTSDPHIFALGDAVQMPSRVTGKPVMVALAAPLSQQAQVVAANVTGEQLTYPGPVGSFVCKVFDLTVASTGVSEAHLQRYDIPFRKVIVPTTNHVYFFPGVAQIFLKVLFDPDSGRLLGAQAVGGEGTEKRIDVLATAIASGLTIFDLDRLELCYAPPYGAPRDPVNLAGSIGAALIRGKIRGIYPDQLDQLDSPVIIDIRTLDEYLVSSLPGAIHIPATDLRTRVHEIEYNRPVVVVCAIGSKANTSQRMLSQMGYDCYNLLGGFTVWRLFHPAPEPGPQTRLASENQQPHSAQAAINPDEVLDVRGLTCPGPIVAVSKRMKKLLPGASLAVMANDPNFEYDIQAWAKRTHCQVSNSIQSGCSYTLILCKSESSVVNKKPSPRQLPAA